MQGMDTLIDEIIKGTFGILTPIILSLVTAWIYRKLQVVNITLSAEQRAKLEMIAQQGILYAEEWARRQVQAGAAATSGEKLDQAVDYIVGQMPATSREAATDLVHALMPRVRAAVEGFLQPPASPAVMDTRTPVVEPSRPSVAAAVAAALGQ